MQFASLRIDFGVDTSKAPATMVVPVGGDNFILVHGSKSVRTDTVSKRIKVHEIKDSAELDREIERLRYIGLQLGNSPVRKLLEWLIGIYKDLTEEDGKLFKIHADSGGFATVTFIDTATKTRLALNVYMLQKQEYNVDCRFPFALDAHAQRHRLSKMPLAKARHWIDEVNVIFGPQVNIHFKLVAASEPFINERIVAVTSGHWDKLKSDRNPDVKTITIYVAASILTSDRTHPYGISLNAKTRVILLQDRQSEDELVKTLAHEFGHTLGDMKGVYIGHPGGPGDLMVSLSRWDGVRISSDLVSVLGKQ